MQLIPAFPDLVMSLQNPIHLLDRPEVGTLVKKRRPGPRGGRVDEALAVQHIKNLAPFLKAQRP